METADNAAAGLHIAASLLEASSRKGKVPVLLLPSPAAVSRVRKTFAGGPLAFGVRIETLPAWVEDRWELFGDGRRIVSSSERLLLVYRAILEASSDGVEIDATPGTVDIVSALARDALPYLLDNGQCASGVSLSGGERAVIASLARYAAALEARGQCEASQAAMALPSVLGDAPPMVLLGFDELGCSYERMVSKLAERADVVRVDDACLAPDADEPRDAELAGLLSRLFRPSSGQALAPSGSVRFLLPAGRYAEASLMAEEVRDLVNHERQKASQERRAALPVVVACREPVALFGSMADFLARNGIGCALSARVSFAETDFGRAFLALAHFACDDEARLAFASDFALSSFSHIPQRIAWSLDAAWRADRTVGRARIASDLIAASASAADALACLAQGDLDGALAVFEDRLRRRSDLDAGYKSMQLAAIASARRFSDAAKSTGSPLLAALSLLERVAVSSAMRTAPQGKGGPREAFEEGLSPVADVLFAGLSEVAERSACSCAALVLGSLTASDYPVRTAENGATLLLEKLELCQPSDALASSRRRFFRALETARDVVVCERVAHTVDADEAYPAVMFEELLDCYRADPTRMDDLDRITGLPQTLLPFTRTAGEDDLQGNLAMGFDPANVQSWDAPRSGEVSSEGRRLIVLPRETAAGAGSKLRLALSPSAIESYLECPFKWFSQRRLRLSKPDAGFGPLEMGSFSHGVLKSFYERFIELGHAKVDAENVVEARALLREVFDRHLEFQPELKRTCNPLVPLTAFERAETDELFRRLTEYLDRESALLPGFAPTHFEFDFGGSEPFEYAGCDLRGSVDRIDVNERGQAVVIDYKGSLSDDYALLSASPAAQAQDAVLPHKVQSLIYAQVAKRLLGYDVVGALYVSYGRDGHVMGALDRMVVGEDAVLGLKMDRCGAPGPAAEAMDCGSFGEVVDAVESGIASAAAALSEGLIDPDPRGKEPCKYCPVLACEKRRVS